MPLRGSQRRENSPTGHLPRTFSMETKRVGEARGCRRVWKALEGRAREGLRGPSGGPYDPLNPTRLWEASQNGLFWEAPHRQRKKGCPSLVGISFPS